MLFTLILLFMPAARAMPCPPKALHFEKIWIFASEVQAQLHDEGHTCGYLIRMGLDRKGRIVRVETMPYGGQKAGLTREELRELLQADGPAPVVNFTVPPETLFGETVDVRQRLRESEMSPQAVHWRKFRSWLELRLGSDQKCEWALLGPQ